MITRTIDGVVCRMVECGEVFMPGDLWASGLPFRSAVGQTASDCHAHCVWRPIAYDNPSATGIEAKVCRDIAERQRKGMAKYGTTVADNPLTRKQWLTHAYEEALDMAIYLRRLIDMEPEQ